MSTLRRATWIEEGSAALVSLLVLIVAVATALWGLGWTTSDGRAVRASRSITAEVDPRDLFVVDQGLGRDRRDLGRVLYPFRPHLALVDDGERYDLGSFPFSAVHLVGDVEPARWSLPRGDPAHLLVWLVDFSGVFVQGEDRVSPCRRPHASGGIACGPEPWFYVGPKVAALSGVHTLCLWAHPPRGGGQLHLPVRVPPGLPEAGALAISLNFLDEVRGEGRRSPVTLRVVDGAGGVHETACDNHAGSCGVRVPLTSGVEGPLDLSIETADNGRQLVCLTGGVEPDAQLRGAL